MARIRVKKPTRTVTTSTARPGAARPPKSTSAGVMIVAVFGWLVAIGAGVYLGVVVSNKNQRLAQIKAALPVAIDALQKDIDRREEETVARKTQLASEIAKSVTAQEAVLKQIATTEPVIGQLQMDVGALETTVAKLRESVDAQKESLGIGDEGLQDLQKMYNDLIGNKRVLKREYETRYAEMETEFQAKLALVEPVALYHFYHSHRHTPFGPAAGYFVADKFFAGKEKDKALRIYAEVAKLYPDSDYAGAANDRITEITERTPFEESTMRFIPYKKLEFSR